MGALGELPRGLLIGSVLLLLGRMPPNGGGVEEHLGSLQGRETRCLGIPLIPADEHAEIAGACLPVAEAEIARGEVELLVEERIVRNVHLAVLAEVFSIRFDDRGGVVVETRRPALEERGNDHHAEILGEFPEGLRGGTGNRFREFEILVVLALAEIFAQEELGQTDHLRTLPRRLSDQALGGDQVLGGRGDTAHLHEPDAEKVGCLGLGGFTLGGRTF